MTDPKVEAAWKKAQELERQGEFKQAEAVIREHISGGFPQQTAYLYELRMERLLAEGDREGAMEAYKRACDWWYFFASGATSGGEGVAFSYQRDKEIAELSRKMGVPPPE